jgi:lysophospholipase L1-like esterase
VIERIRELLADEAKPITWVLTGDSITHGALHTFGWRSYPELFAERVRFELGRVRDIVINTGISGDRTGGLLADFDWRVARFQPHVVSVMMGMNDCSDGPAGRDKFRSQLIQIVERISALPGATPLLHTMNTITPLDQGRKDLPAYVEIIREVAAARHLALVDHYAVWGKNPTFPYWLGDATIHPNEYGHRAMANQIFRDLAIFDAASPTCRLLVS